MVPQEEEGPVQLPDTDIADVVKQAFDLVKQVQRPTALCDPGVHLCGIYGGTCVLYLSIVVQKRVTCLGRPFKTWLPLDNCPDS